MKADVTYEIRNAQPADLPAILRTVDAQSLPSVGVGENLDGFLVASATDRVIGTIGMEQYGSDALLRSLAVASGAELSGVGSALVRQFLDRARALGKQRVFLLTTSAAGYFERFGFRELPPQQLPAAVKTSKEFSGCCAAGAAAMSLDLAAPLARDTLEGDALRDSVKQKYAAVASRAKAAAGASCCGPKTGPKPSVKTQVTRDLYVGEEVACLPTTAVDGSRGCGNPTAISALKPGDVVLDLGSGAGADVFLAASKVRPSGKVYGLDMTREMIEVARAGQRELGIDNVEFILGEMERIPLPDTSVDVVISNCVISLVQDKDRVFREIARVLRPEGRITLSDIVSTADVPGGLRDDLNSWLGCLGGALSIDLYREKLERAGFTNINIGVTRVYDLDALLTKEMQAQGANAAAALDEVKAWNGQICAASVTATVPAPA